jgi:bifunctional non-homologous end joining protein LigD
MAGPFTMRFPADLPAAKTGDRWIVHADGRDVALSNLDKVFWPDEGITKGDLLAYYYNVAPVILPSLDDRPLALKRMPNGVTGRAFFQRNAPTYTPDWITLCAIEPEDSEIDETIVIHRLCDLMFVVNLGCIELHPLHSRCERYDRPDYMVVDLDPMEPAGFDEAAVIAQQVKVVLDHIGLRGYAKTSGATGVQVYVPIEEKHSYDETRALAEAIGLAIVRAARDLATMEWSVTKRRGKVFIDHKMNRRAASLASVYSVRPQPGGTVSTPVTWDELLPGRVTAQSFTMETIFDRLRDVGDLFRPVVTEPQELDGAMRALGVRASRADISGGRVRRHVSSGKRSRRG